LKKQNKSIASAGRVIETSWHINAPVTKHNRDQEYRNAIKFIGTVSYACSVQGALVIFTPFSEMLILFFLSTPFWHLLMVSRNADHSLKKPQF
jgi:hypothetical protein